MASSPGQTPGRGERCRCFGTYPARSAFCCEGGGRRLDGGCTSVVGCTFDATVGVGSIFHSGAVLSARSLGARGHPADLVPNRSALAESVWQLVLDSDATPVIPAHTLLKVQLASPPPLGGRQPVFVAVLGATFGGVVLLALALGRCFSGGGRGLGGAKHARGGAARLLVGAGRGAGGPCRDGLG